MRRPALPILLGAGAALLGGCAGSGSTVLGPTPPSSVSPVGSSPIASPAAAKSAAVTASPHSLADVQSWSEPAIVADEKPAMMLAGLTAQPAALLIVDPASLAATSAKNDKVKPLDAIREGGKRKVLALLQISEIAPTDSAWNKAWTDNAGKLTKAAPAWLQDPDAKSTGLYHANYWDKDWQKQITGALNKLVASGYDGVCLQGAGDFTGDVKGHATAAADMAAFVESLAARARQKNPGFSVVTEGGESLPGALVTADGKLYYAAIDGIVVHDVFYPGPKPTDNDLLPSSDVLADLDDFHDAGKSVFVTERLTDPNKIADFLTRAKSKGYIPDALLMPVPALPPANADPKVADDRT